MNEEEKALRKKWIKEAFKEWLAEEKQRTYESIGKWVLQTFALLLVGAMVSLVLWANGFKHDSDAKTADQHFPRRSDER